MTYNIDEPVQNPTYKPMNVHPNPYGNGVTPDVMPQQEHARPPPLSDEQKRMLTTSEQTLLPSRDIPMILSVIKMMNVFAKLQQNLNRRTIIFRVIRFGKS